MSPFVYATAGGLAAIVLAAAAIALLLLVGRLLNDRKLRKLRAIRMAQRSYVVTAACRCGGAIAFGEGRMKLEFEGMHTFNAPNCTGCKEVRITVRPQEAI